VRVRALSVFEGVVYHCVVVDPAQPCRPTLEVEAVLRPGDADADAGPLLLSVAEYIVMVGGLDAARPCLRQLAEQGRIVTHLDVEHISFPTWSRVGPATASHEADDDHGTADDASVADPPTPPSLRVIDGGSEPQRLPDD
jgi:hypothetical protein